MEDINFYKNNGYFIKKNLLDDKICRNILLELDKIKTDMTIPHTKKQFGYGNVINHSLSKYITDNNYVKYFCENIYGKRYFYNSVYVHNKHKWVGPDVEWHQEVFNIKTFHPTNINYTINEIKNNFMQVYVVLEDQHIENGGLKIIPYQDSILEHYDTTNTHLNHKRAIIPEDLDRIYSTHGIINLDLKAGDVMFFNHLIPHSSSSNNSPFNRKAMVFLTYKNNIDFDESIRIEEKNYRKQFALNYLKTSLRNKSDKKIYECGEKSKKIEKTWSSIFEDLPWYDKKFKNDYSIESLLAANGHSVSKTGAYTIEKWDNTIKSIKNNLNYDTDVSYKVMEIGCGAGALLKYFENDKNNIYGIEPSNTYYNIIRNAIPNGDFKLGDALTLNKYNDNMFNIILCYSVTQYFKDIRYFEIFINMCYEKLKVGGKLFIGDILDKDLQQKYNTFRINQMGIKEYNEKYKKTGLSHFYISKSQIRDILKKFDLIKINNSEKRGEEDLHYRFNIYYQKNK